MGSTKICNVGVFHNWAIIGRVSYLGIMANALHIST